MAFITADRIKETTTVTGTGPITLLGAVSGYRPFSSVMLSIGDTCPYAIVNADASQWEVGIATYTDVNTLTRTTIHASTADPDTDPVDFAAGIKDVFLAPTARTVLSDLTSNDGTVTLTKVGSIVDLSVAIAAATENVIVQVRNNTGATLTKGTVVYINDALGQLPTVAKALATSDATSAQTLGMISADLGNNENGYVTIIGLIDDISLDTGIYSDGDQLYLSGTTAGAFTNVKPYAPTHLVYVGVVEHAHNVHGKIFVKVQNGYELDELHDVSAQSPSNGQTIVYNSTNQLWEKNYVSRTNSLSAVPVVSGAGNSLTLAAGSGVGTGAGGSLILQAGIQATSGGDGTVIVKQSTGQTSNLQEWQDSSGNIRGYISATDSSTVARFSLARSGGSEGFYVTTTNGGTRGLWLTGSMSAAFGCTAVNNTDGGSIVTGSAIATRGDVGEIGFGAGTNPASRDVVLRRDAADTLAQRRTTNPQSFRVYNTYTDASNYERLGITWASNICTIGPESAGTGTPRALTFSTSNLATTGTAPSLSITAGSGTVTGAKGGSINITAGNGGAGNGGGGGSVVIAAGQAVGDNVQPSGNITLTAGANGGAGTTGSVTVQGGSASTGGAVAGGVVYIYGGAQATPGNVSTVASTGSVVIKSPDSLTSMGSSGTSTVNPTGSVSITTGNGGTISTASTQTTISNGGSGTITITTGAGASATTVGTTRNAGNSGTITISTSAGGSASGGTTNNGGSSGSIIISTGAAGTGSTTNGTSGTVRFNIGGVNTANVLSTGLGSNAVTAIPLPSAATVTAASGNGTTITYTCANTFSVGQIVSVTGLTTTTGSSLNIANMTIATASSTQFTVTNTTVGTAAATQAGTATIQSAGNSVTITAGSGSGVGAGGDIILQPGVQGTSGGNGYIKAASINGSNYLSIDTNTTQQIVFRSNTVVSFSISNYPPQRGYIGAPSTGGFAWADNATGDFSNHGDLYLSRDAANTLAQRNGTNAQSFRVYNTYTDASNYERLGISWATNTCTIASENAGTGTKRDVKLEGLNITVNCTGSGYISVTKSGGTLFTINNGSYAITCAGAYGIASGTDFRLGDASNKRALIWQSGTSLIDDAANIIGIRNGVNAQSYRVYNTYTDASNYERFGIEWATNICTIGLAQAGTGSTRNLVVAGANATTGAGGNVTITAGNGSGVGAGGNIILQPGAQGTSGGNGKIRINDTAGVDTGFNFTRGYAGYPTLEQSRLYLRAATDNNQVIEFRADAGAGSLSMGPTGSQVLLGGNNTNYVGIKERSNSGTLAVISSSGSVGGSLSFVSATTAIAANTNDLALPASAFHRLNCTSPCSLTGIAPVTGTGSVHVDGRMIRVYNVGTANLTLSHNSASSAAANRFYNATGADIVLSTHQYVELIYDSTDNGRGGAGWRVSSVH